VLYRCEAYIVNEDEHWYTLRHFRCRDTSSRGASSSRGGRRGGGGGCGGGGGGSEEQAQEQAGWFDLNSLHDEPLLLSDLASSHFCCDFLKQFPAVNPVVNPSLYRSDLALASLLGELRERMLAAEVTYGSLL